MKAINLKLFLLAGIIVGASSVQAEGKQVIPHGSTAAASQAAGVDAKSAPCSTPDTGYVLDTSVHGKIGSNNPVNACADILRSSSKEASRLRIFIDGKLAISNDTIVTASHDHDRSKDYLTPLLKIEHGSLAVRNSNVPADQLSVEIWHLTTRNGQWIIAGRTFNTQDTWETNDTGVITGYNIDANMLSGEMHSKFYDYKRAGRDYLICKIPSDLLHRKLDDSSIDDIRSSRIWSSPCQPEKW